jgi:periplasmic nitrate reductase NapD
MTHAAGPEELHISSLVVHAAPHRLARVAELVAALPGAFVHALSNNGKLVVTLETSSANDMTAQVSCIQHIDGVLSAALVYQCADSLAAMNEEMIDA